MNIQLDELLRRWREGTISDEEMRQLTESLVTQEGREALRNDWFLEEVLPEALRTSPVLGMLSRPSLMARWTEWLRLKTGATSYREEDDVLFGLRLWARGSLAAVPLGMAVACVALWLAWQKPYADTSLSEPSFLAQCLLENDLP